jgi:hypothetical protein
MAKEMANITLLNSAEITNLNCQMRLREFSNRMEELNPPE